MIQLPTRDSRMNRTIRPHMSALLTDEFLRDSVAIHRLAMQSLFERLDSLCEGAVAVDRQARVVWVKEKYLGTPGLTRGADGLGREIGEVLPNSLVAGVGRSGPADPPAS